MTSLDENKPKINFGVSKYKNMMGITCYMNSILHILQQTPEFVLFITKCQFRDTLMRKMISSNVGDQDKWIKDKVIFELFRLFKTSLENDDKCITPTTFKEVIGKRNDMWDELRQQDSQEFFNFLITQLEEEIGEKTIFLPGNNMSNIAENKEITFDDSIKNIIAIKSWINYQSKEYSPLKNMFNGMSQTITRCSCCGLTNFVFEPFVTLAVSIPKNKSNVDLYDCIDNMITEEQLDEDNKMNCNMCGIKNRGYSKTMLWKTPKILVIHLKRFSVNAYGMHGQKINTNVLYPYKDLDMMKYFDDTSPYKDNSKYDLIGINLHQSFGFGSSINSGHYTSLVKSMINNNWYHYNDGNTVQLVTKESNLQNSNAYMLFYYRHD